MVCFYYRKRKEAHAMETIVISAIIWMALTLLFSNLGLATLVYLMVVILDLVLVIAALVSIVMLVYKLIK